APSQLAGQAVEPIPDQCAVNVELLPSDVGRDAIPQSVEAVATWLAGILPIGRADDAEAPVHEGGDVEAELTAVEEVKAYGRVGVEPFVLTEEPDLAEDDVVEHRVKVGPRGARRVVHDLVRHELRLALVAVLEQPEELRGERVWDNRQALDLTVGDLELRRSDELAVGRVGEVRVRIDLAGHQHRAVHRKAAMLAHHRLAAHFHGRGPEQAEEAPEVEHEERLLAETELASGEVASALEDHRVRRTFDLDEETQLGQKRPRQEQGDLVGWRELRLGLSRRHRVLEEPALDAKGEAVDQRLPCAVLPDAGHDPTWLGGTRDLEAHHVELLAEPVQSRRAGVAGVALKVVLSREGRHRLHSPGAGEGDQPYDQRGQTGRDKHDHSEAFEHALP